MSSHPSLKFWLIYLKYSDLFDDPVTEQTLNDLLKTFRRAELLILLSKVGLILHNERWDNAKIQPFLATAFFDDNTLRRIQEVARQIKKADQNVTNPIIFSEFQIINLIKRTILYCTDEVDTLISSDEERFRFGKCCLLMNEILTAIAPKLDETNREEVREKLTEEIVRNLLFQENEFFANGFARAYELYWKIPKEMTRHPEFYDIPGAFEKATGFSVPEYLAIGFTIWSWWFNVKMDTVADSNQVLINPKTFFQNLPLGKIKRESIFSQLSLSVDDYKKELIRERVSLGVKSQFHYSNLTLEQYPLVQCGEELICLSMKHLERKLTANLFYTLNNLLPAEERLRYRTFFGRVFEEYVRQILKRCVGERCKIDYYGTSNKEAGEAVLVYPRVLIILEAKSSRISLECARSGDLSNYLEDIKKVVVAASRQIDRVIKDFKDGEYTINGVKTYRIGRFYPVVITAHSFPQAPFILSEIDKFTTQEKIFHDDDIAPITLVSIGELELLEPLLSTQTMYEILGEKTGKTEYRELSMRNFIFEFYRYLPQNEAIKSKGLEIMKYMQKLLFPDGDKIMDD